MKRSRFTKILLSLLFAVAMLTAFFWNQIAGAFGPMRQNESQCLICHRDRVEKWVCGSKVSDQITTNQYSDWIDTFTPAGHAHVWSGVSSLQRSYWFGGTSIGCGGIAAIPRIFEHRDDLGERKAQQLAACFHDLVDGPSSELDWSELDAFTQTVVDDPESLLQP